MNKMVLAGNDWNQFVYQKAVSIWVDCDKDFPSRSVLCNHSARNPFWDLQLKLGLITFTWLNLMCTYPVQPCLHILLAVCTSLFILLFIKSTVYCIAHFTPYCFLFLFYSYLYLYIFSCVRFHFYIFALSVERTCPDLHFTTDYILYNWVCDE